MTLSAGFFLFSTEVFLGDLEIYFFDPVSEDLGEMVEQGEPGRQIGGQGRQCDMDGVKKNQYPPGREGY